MQAIMVPVDFSEYSESALKAAADIARKKESELYVIHVVELGTPVWGTGELHVDNENLLFFSKLAKEKLHEFLDKDYLRDIPITNIIELGPTYRSITKNIEEYDIDLIVMGSKGSSGIEGFFIGSNTEKVVRNSSVPVLVIKDKLMDLHFDKIVFVSDFDIENTLAFHKTLDFAKNFNAEVKLMDINTKGENPKHIGEMQEKIREFIKASGSDFNPDEVIIYHDDKVEEGILKGAKSLGADLIAMATHGRKGLAHLFNGSIAEDVVNHSKTPVITFKIK